MMELYVLMTQWLQQPHQLQHHNLDTNLDKPQSLSIVKSIIIINDLTH